MRRRALRLLLCLLLVPGALHAQDGRVWHSSGYGLVVPAGWEVIPEDVIEDLRAREAALALRGSLGAYFSSGLAGPGGEEWLSFPYVLMRMDTLGPISHATLRKQVDADQMDEADVVRMREAGLITGHHASAPVWDEARNVLLTEFVVDRPDGIVARGVMALLPHRSGTLNIARYDVDGTIDPAEAKAWLLDLVDSVIFVEPMAYDDAAALAAERRRGGGSFWGRVGGRAAIGAVVGMVVALLLSPFRRRRSETLDAGA